MKRKKIKITYDQYVDIHNKILDFGKMFDLNYSQVYRGINEDAIPRLLEKMEERRREIKSMQDKLEKEK